MLNCLSGHHTYRWLVGVLYDCFSVIFILNISTVKPDNSYILPPVFHFNVIVQSFSIWESYRVEGVSSYLQEYFKSLASIVERSGTTVKRKNVRLFYEQCLRPIVANHLFK
jgi:hypothetical protein